MTTIAETDSTHRRLKNRHVQLIGIGGTIGTVLFVQLGTALSKGGPGSLFIAFALWCVPVLFITNCTAEMVSYLPISSPFIRFAGRYCDEALEVMAGWNFFFFEAVLVPFELTAVNVVLHFWIKTEYSPAITFAIQMVLYMMINLFAVKWYGESEFWLSIGKMLLALGLICFTFVTMVGGNPLRDAYGFRFWNEPGAFAEYYSTGNKGRFLGFMACFIQACYTITGPEYVSMAAGETAMPRTTMPKAYKSVFYRLTFFFIMGSLCLGIVVPYNDPELLLAIKTNKPGAAASPYVIAMQRLQIPVLPHIVNAMILTACFSAGNSYCFCASRTLYGLALDGHAPKFFKKCTKNGVPIWSTVAVLAVSCLAFLQLGKTASVVLNWIINLVTASQLINNCVICLTYIRFYNGLKVQGISRDTLPYKGFFQPYCAYIALVACAIMTFISGFFVFLDGNWDIPTFLFSYIMIPVNIFVFVTYKVFQKTKWKSIDELDFLSGKAAIDEYEEKEALRIQHKELERERQFQHDLANGNITIHQRIAKIWTQFVEFLF
ncbi:hypothetical protein NADFUDRAFT_19230 [Nadsonia fulvescens var. elongata DSM 6958]|uniref:Amino acid permease/ SLC12A domain-containing protein n=1 Tax=Nadsonia fulvescens var. elongata DSM 6958 TaxID=857566 RepID=A0A1E3PS52_9ASCO|nr:hypothetical protein NADFUDRAFT_19230 [Nadsonia fulvescens var. elongata DSM 6958]